MAIIPDLTGRSMTDVASALGTTLAGQSAQSLFDNRANKRDIPSSNPSVANNSLKGWGGFDTVGLYLKVVSASVDFPAQRQTDPRLVYMDSNVNWQVYNVGGYNNLDVTPTSGGPGTGIQLTCIAVIDNTQTIDKHITREIRSYGHSGDVITTTVRATQRAATGTYLLVGAYTINLSGAVSSSAQIYFDTRINMGSGTMEYFGAYKFASTGTSATSGIMLNGYKGVSSFSSSTNTVGYYIQPTNIVPASSSPAREGVVVFKINNIIKRTVNVYVHSAKNTISTPSKLSITLRIQSWLNRPITGTYVSEWTDSVYSGAVNGRDVVMTSVGESTPVHNISGDIISVQLTRFTPVNMTSVDVSCSGCSVNYKDDSYALLRLSSNTPSITISVNTRSPGQTIG